MRGNREDVAGCDALTEDFNYPVRVDEPGSNGLIASTGGAF